MIRLDAILDQVRAYAPDADTSIIQRAWVFANSYHRGQTRKSGEPYFAHPLEVANILATLKMDVETLAVAILHDTVEDTDATVEQIEAKFGKAVAEMVDGVTKLDKLDFRSHEEAQAENFRKLVFAMARDIRVIVVKLADRLHNMRTLDAMRPEKQARIARETMDLYAPIANRLGIVAVKGELEDLSFRYLHPEVWAELGEQVQARLPWFDAYIEKTKRRLAGKLSELLKDFEVTGRVKRLYSIYLKMQEKQIQFDDVHDLLAFRVLVESPGDCYATLGIVHALWPPLDGRFKDYIAQPKANGYQSLHTTVIGPDNQRIEVQIRTRSMHAFCEYGIAAHWKYKEGRLALSHEEIEEITRIRGLLQWAKDVEDSREFLDVLRLDLYADQVHVYTPRGELRWLPATATALDFAYSIHSEVGNRMTGARVGGRMVKLNYELQPGDMVEIITRNDQQPSKDWLHIAKTGRARSKIRHYLRGEERRRAIDRGRQMLDQELRKRESSLKAAIKRDELRPALETLKCRNQDELFANLGYGRMQVDAVLPLYVDPTLLAAEVEEPEARTLTGLFRAVGRRGRSPVIVDRKDGVLTVFARCCRPIPGDPIIGYVTMGRGITVHRADCRQAAANNADRRVEVQWSAEAGDLHFARLHVITVDRPLMLADLSQTIGRMNVSIAGADVRTTATDRGHIIIDVKVKDAEQLQAIRSRLLKVKGVLSIERDAGA